MSDVDDLAQNIKGKFQKGVGKVKKNSGNETGGAWDEIKGNANEKASEIKQNIKNAFRDNK